MKITQACLLLLFLAPSAFALDEIIRPYQSVRGAGMGGVKLTTGLYEENFFGNPARVTANPKWRFNLISFTPEASTSTLSNISTVAGGGGDTFTKLANTAGTNNHVRLEVLGPSIFIPSPGTKMSYALGDELNFQGDVDLRESYQIDPQIVVDAGLIGTVGRTFMDKDQLAVGMNVHYLYRATTQPGFGLVNVIQGSSSNLKDIAGAGTNFDFDLGSTYILPWKLDDIEFSVAGTVSNVMGGHYNTSTLIVQNSSGAINQPRSFGLGGAARYSAWKFLTDSVLALELTDMGNNANGNFYRLVHMGGETHYGLIAMRLGINQGYWAAGLGFDLKVLTLDFASYGEEMTLNTGGLEDRRLALKVALQI